MHLRPKLAHIYMYREIERYLKEYSESNYLTVLELIRKRINAH